MLGFLGVLLMLGVGIGMLVGAVVTYSDAHSGRGATVKVSECHGGGYRYGSGTHCTGTWATGGPLVGGNGHVVIGTIDNAGYSDIGKTIRVRIHGDRATKPQARLPIILFVLGLLIAGSGIYFAWLWQGSVRASRAPAT